MSKLYRDKYGYDKVSKEELRVFLRPKFDRDKDGKVITMTEQAHKDECDVNNIIKKYDKTGLINHVSKINAMYGDVSPIDFKSAQDMLIDVRRKFDEMPSDIRKRFRNSPYEMLKFLSDPENRNEAIKIGLIRNDWTDATDGIGEKVKLGENVVEKVVEKKE